MKKAMMFLLFVFAATTAAFSHASVAKDPKVKEQIIALEKAGWEAWKMKHATWFKTNLTEDFVMINSEGLGTKAQVVKSTTTYCAVKAYTLDVFKLVMLK